MYTLYNLLVENKPSYKLYCDMDGVLCNFDKRFQELAKMSPDSYEEEYSTDEFWRFIDIEIGIRFWSDMEWTNGGKQLWNFISKYNPELLTSPSKHNHSRVGKAIWVKNNLKPIPKINFKYSKEKQEFSNSNSILIDDRTDIIDRWRTEGGIGIHCPKNTENINTVIDQLRELGYE